MSSVVDTINRLAAATSNSRFPMARNRATPGASPTKHQSRMVEEIRQTTSLFGSQPDDLSVEGALSELLADRSLYEQTPRNLARYEPERLRVAHGDFRPKSAEELLSPAVSGYIRHYDLCIERPADSLTSEELSALPTVYMDPVLRQSRQVRLDLFRRLISLGVFSARRSIKEEVGLFFVKKKHGDIRMVIDCRRTNARHHQPPPTRLGSVEAMGELDLSHLSAESSGSGQLAADGVGAADADLRDGFYQMSVRRVASWFGIREAFRASELGIDRAWCDELQQVRPFDPDEFVFPVVESLCMGWSWALFFCNEVLTETVCAVSSRGSGGLLLDRAPAPPLTEGHAIHSVYADNYTAVGATECDTRKAHADFSQACRDKDLLLHECHDYERSLEVLGSILDCRRRVLYQKPRRVWRAFLAGHCLLQRGWVHPMHVEVWLGHMVHLFSLCRPAMSVFQEIYLWLSRSHGRSRLWPVVRQEISMACSLCFMCAVRLDLPFHPLVQMGDSSDEGYALVDTAAAPDEVLQEWRLRERWRFMRAPPPREIAGVAPDYADWAAGLSPLGGLRAAAAPDSAPPRTCVPTEVRGLSASLGQSPKTSYRRWLEERADVAGLRGRPSRHRHRRQVPRATSEVELPNVVPPISTSWDPRGRWHTVLEKAWRFPQEHINVKECRVALLALRRASRLKSAVRSRLLIFSDSLVSCAVLDKGRSRSRALNSIARRFASYSLALSCRPRVRHVETERNHADWGSRLVELQRRAANRVLRRTGAETSEAPAPVPLVLALLVAPPGLSPPDSEHGVVEPKENDQADSVACVGAVFDASETFMLELFSGCGRLSGCGRRKGLRVAPGFDITSGAQFDLSRRSTQECILSLIRQGRIWYVHLGTPCTIWSSARTNPSDSMRSRARERVGVDFAMFSARVAQECSRCRVYWTIENPANSRLWNFPPIAALQALPAARRIVFDMCMYDQPYKKPTAVLGNLPHLDRLSCRCCHPYPHIRLEGSRTTQAGQYPESLCLAWASILRECAPPSAFGNESVFLRQWLRGLPRSPVSHERALLASDGRGLRGARAAVRRWELSPAEQTYLIDHRVLAGAKPGSQRQPGLDAAADRDADCAGSRREVPPPPQQLQEGSHAAGGSQGLPAASHGRRTHSSRLQPRGR